MMKTPISVRQFGCLLVTFIYAVGILALIVVGVSLLCGCSPTKYVPVETVRTEYRDADTTAIYNHLLRLFETKHEKESRSDSLFDRTKEVVVLKENGDTARYDRVRIVYRSTANERELEHKINEQDSMIAALRIQLSTVKADSIAVPYPVERELSRWEKAKMDFGGIAFGGLFAAIAITVVWLIRKFRR